MRIVLAHRDPGPACPTGSTPAVTDQGAMLFRYVGAREHPPIATRLVRFDELSALATGTIAR